MSAKRMLLDAIVDWLTDGCTPNGEFLAQQLMTGLLVTGDSSTYVNCKMLDQYAKELEVK